MMELNAFFFLLIHYLFLLEREREKLSADYVGGQQVDKICHIFTSSLMLCLFLLPFFHTRTHTHTKKPINFYEPNKSGSHEDGHTDKHADLAPFFSPARHRAPSFCPFYQTQSQPLVLHPPTPPHRHPCLVFCRAHPLPSSVTSPYVSRRSSLHPSPPDVWFKFEVFAPPAVCVFPPTLTLLPHLHCLNPPIPPQPLTSGSVPLCLGPLLSSFLLLPLFFTPHSSPPVS